MTPDSAVDAYLRAVAAGMPGPPRARRDILAELRSGLFDAIDARRSAGVPAQAATAAAITEFGDPRQVASAFRPHLAMSRARRTALTLVAAATAASLTRLALARRAARSCLAIRATLS